MGSSIQKEIWAVSSAAFCQWMNSEFFPDAPFSEYFVKNPQKVIDKDFWQAFFSEGITPPSQIEQSAGECIQN
jgi:hypothetical protein